MLLSSGGGSGGGATVDGPAIAVSDHPVDLAYGEGGLWVANRIGGSVSFIADGSDKATEPVRIGGAPEGIGVGLGFVYVSNGDGNSVLKLDPSDGHLVNEIATGNARPGLP